MLFNFYSLRKLIVIHKWTQSFLFSFADSMSKVVNVVGASEIRYKTFPEDEEYGDVTSITGFDPWDPERGYVSINNLYAQILF